MIKKRQTRWREILGRARLELGFIAADKVEGNFRTWEVH